MLLIAGFVLTSDLSAQTGECPDQQVIWQETFGQGTTATAHPDVLNLRYQADNPLNSEGVYRIINNTQQKPEWHASADHTGDANGKMLVANGQAEVFFQKVVNAPGANFGGGWYSVGVYAMNINTLGTCSPDPLLPDFVIMAEFFNPVSNTWTSLANSPSGGQKIMQSSTPTWEKVNGNFYLPSIPGVNITQIRLTISDGTVGGCGNDFAVDDITLAVCPEGGPAPVTFTTISAKVKGNGVIVEWGTSQEANNDHFEIERSADGNTGWQTLTTVKGAGFSQVPRNYNVYDDKPFAGFNYYRIKQVDIDGKYDYSKTVNARIEGLSTNVRITGNPFRNNFSVTFSGMAQEVNARLVDMTGKQIAREVWNLSGGETTKQFGNISGLQNGIYILTIQNKSGEILFNGKVMKQ